MGYAQDVDGNLTVLEMGTIWANDVQFSYETMLAWTDDGRAAYGIFPIVDDDIPSDKIALSSSLERDGNLVRRTFVLGDKPASSPPSEVSDLQFRLALNAVGLRDEAEAYIAAASQDVKDWWDRATRIVRTDPILVAAVAALGQTEADLDEVMTLAATL